jgi:hypothetical protein
MWPFSKRICHVSKYRVLTLTTDTSAYVIHRHDYMNTTARHLFLSFNITAKKAEEAENDLAEAVLRSPTARCCVCTAIHLDRGLY